jgi:hypothetical protein
VFAMNVFVLIRLLVLKRFRLRIVKTFLLRFVNINCFFFVLSRRTEAGNITQEVCVV